MTPAILGMGWVTPLGRSLDHVYQAILDGKAPSPSPLENPLSKKTHPTFHIAPETVADATGIPRLRRSSAISHFAVAAALDALAASGLPQEAMSRTALIFAASDGGVAYTRRFYADVVASGPGAGSPLLFPETVYNAPASHIAARLGIEGTALSLVGDATAAFSAIQTASELLETGEAEYGLVVASQELDWITCDAYQYWNPGERSVYSEGAAALLLGRDMGGHATLRTHPGASYSTTTEAARHLRSICEDLCRETLPDTIISSAAGSQLERNKTHMLADLAPSARVIGVKEVLGEAHCVSTMQEIVAAALAAQNTNTSRSLVSAIGFNGQVSALILTR